MGILHIVNVFQKSVNGKIVKNGLDCIKFS